MNLDLMRRRAVARWSLAIAAVVLSIGRWSESVVGAETADKAISATADIKVDSGAVAPEAAPATADGMAAAAPCIALREHDQVWLISTRGLGCPDASAAPALRLWRYTAAGGWADSTLEAFLAADDPSMPTDFYLHGNFDSADDAVQQGLAIYGRLSAQAPADRPFRFVAWSWPTDRGKHPLQLTRMHAHRADVEAYYLGWLVNRMDHRVKVGLIGYSLGTRGVTGALHLLGGGQLLGLALGIDPKAPRQTVRAALLAAAEDCDWLTPGRPNGESVGFVDKMLLLNNSCDSVLKMYPHMERCSRADSLGYVGICGPFDSQKVEQLDVCCAIGKPHEWSRYFYNASLVADMLPYLFLDAAK